MIRNVGYEVCKDVNFTLTGNCEPVVRFSQSVCSVGKWSSIDHSEFNIQPSKTAADLINREWLCPGAHSSCWHHRGSCLTGQLNPNDSRTWAQHWVASDARCMPFHPVNFFTHLQNKTLIFIGDSIMEQIFEQLLLNLYAWSNIVSRYIVPPRHMEDSFHEAHVPEVGMFLLRHDLYTYEGFNNFRAQYHVHGWHDDHIIIFNIGIHYNNASEYEEDLRQLAVELRAENNLFLFLQSTPQHFGGDDGYYMSTPRSMHLACQPLTGATLTEQITLDWRNAIAEEVFRFHPRVRIVRIAAALYERWDSHVEMRSEMFTQLNEADCTHYCVQNRGVFDYIHRMLYNAIMDEIADQ